MAAYDTYSKGVSWALRAAADTGSGTPGTYTTIGYGTQDTQTETFETERIVDRTAGLNAANTLGAFSWTRSYTGNYVPGDTGVAMIKTIMAAQKANPSLTPYWWQLVMVDPSTGTPVTGAPEFEGQALLTERTINTDAESTVTFSINLLGYGDLVESVVS